MSEEDVDPWGVDEERRAADPAQISPRDRNDNSGEGCDREQKQREAALASHDAPQMKDNEGADQYRGISAQLADAQREIERLTKQYDETARVYINKCHEIIARDTLLATLAGALRGVSCLYDTDEGCRALPEYKAAHEALALYDKHNQGAK